jgi:hypothetical protein
MPAKPEHCTEITMTAVMMSFIFTPKYFAASGPKGLPRPSRRTREPALAAAVNVARHIAARLTG